MYATMTFSEQFFKLLKFVMFLLRTFCCRFHKSQRKSRQKQEQKKLEQIAADDPEAYQNWVRNAEKQRIQVCHHFSQQIKDPG